MLLSRDKTIFVFSRGIAIPEWINACRQFYLWRIVGKLEEGCSMRDVANEFGTAKGVTEQS